MEFKFSISAVYLTLLFLMLLLTFASAKKAAACRRDEGEVELDQLVVGGERNENSSKNATMTFGSVPCHRVRRVANLTLLYPSVVSPTSIRIRVCVGTCSVASDGRITHEEHILLKEGIEPCCVPLKYKYRKMLVRRQVSGKSVLRRLKFPVATVQDHLN